MITHIDKQFPLVAGLDCYSPAIISDQLRFYTLSNAEPRLNRIFASQGFAAFQDFVLETGESIKAFAMYQLVNRQFVNVYAITETRIYWFDFETGEFDQTPIYTGFLSSAYDYVIIPWYDAVYITKWGNPYVRVQRKIATAVAGVPSARYGLVANSHVFLAGINDGITAHLARTRWSDLEEPESWTIYPATSEADFFDLEADSMEITGLSYQRGTALVYSQNTIWGAYYIGFPGGFRHEPLFPGIGNIFHGALVRNKEVDYFIGRDNFYELNGLQIVPIGTEIFERFIADVRIDENTAVRGYLDSRKNQVFWVYTRTTGQLWSIVYNYVERKWSERDPQGLTAFFDSPRTVVRGHDVIDHLSTTINNISTLIDNLSLGTARALPQLVGGSGSIPLAQVASEPLKVDGEPFDHVAETFDFFFETFTEVKEFIRVDVDFKGTGIPALELEIGTRNNQNASISWSSPLTMEQFDGSYSFFFRTEAVGKYTRFRLSWNNSAENKIDELLLLSLRKVQHTPDDNPTK